LSNNFRYLYWLFQNPTSVSFVTFLKINLQLHVQQKNSNDVGVKEGKTCIQETSDLPLGIVRDLCNISKMQFNT